MIDDVWNSRRQSTQKEKELQEPGLLLKKIMLTLLCRICHWPPNFCHIQSDLSGHTVWPPVSPIQKIGRAFLMNFCPLRNVKRGDALEFRYLAAGHFVQL